MATTTNITTTYAGEFAGQYVAASLLSANTIANGGVEVKPNVKYKQVLKTAATADIITDASCDFTPGGSLTLAERIIQPKELKVNLELCKADFRSDWEAESMGFSAHDNLPANFQDFLLRHIASQVAEVTEQDIWGGSDTDGHFAGFVPQMLADANTVKVAGASIDASNIVASLSAVLSAVPTKVYGNEDLHIYVSQKAKRAYIEALGGFGASGLGANGYEGKGAMWYAGGELSFGGVKIFAAQGLADNTIVAARKSNLFFGTGLLADHNEVRLLDMADLNGSDNVRVIMKYTAGTQYAISQDVVIFDPSIS